MGKKSSEEILVRVKEIIEPVISDLGMEIYDIEMSRSKGKALVRVFIDKPEGISIDDCTNVSREIEAILDVEDPVPYAYVLEVSSPGLDRALKSPQHFMRFKGSSVRVVTQEPIGKQTFFIGKIAKAGDSEIVLSLPKSKEVVIPYNNISRARLEVEV